MANTRYPCPILTKLEFSRQIIEKYSNIELYENPSSGRQVVPCERTYVHADGRTDMTNVIVAFRNFADASKNFSVPCTTV
jgi:hypothetical protein